MVQLCGITVKFNSYFFSATVLCKDYCDNNAQCVFVKQAQEYQCTCKSGYEGNGLECAPMGQYWLNNLLAFIKISNHKVYLINNIWSFILINFNLFLSFFKYLLFNISILWNSCWENLSKNADSSPSCIYVKNLFCFQSKICFIWL